MYKVNQSLTENFFYVQIKDEINYQQIIDFLQIVVDNKVVDGSLLLYTDYEDVVVKEKTPQPIKYIAEFVTDVLKQKYKYVKWALTSNNHMPIAGAMYLKSLVKDKNINMEVFSTREATFSWLGVSEKEVKDLKEIVRIK